MQPIRRFRGALLGLACGDAVGTTIEFMSREEFEPMTDMVGGGPFSLKPGEWTDDTSMALCLATSLIECGGFDAYDQMQRYCRWMDEGYLSSNGECFDIGMTVSTALRKFQRTGEAYAGSDNPRTAGNGCLMRLAPVPMFFARDRSAAIEQSGMSSVTTHAADECVKASRLFGGMLWRALEGASKDDILLRHGVVDERSGLLASIALGEYVGKDASLIRGSGYVVQSLEAALWAFAGTETFEAAILCAANLGDDADTTAAICGQIAGAYYGESAIPHHWRERLVMAAEIQRLADKLYEASGTMDAPH